MTNLLLSNECLLLLQILISFGGVILSFRLWGKTGLFAWAAFITLFANLEVNSFCTMFGLTVSLGNVAFVSLALAQDILSENYGQNIAKKSVYIGFFAAIAVVIISWFSIHFNCPDGLNGGNHEAFCQVFGSVGAIVLASLISYFCSNCLNVWLYAFIRKYTQRIWLRTQFSTWTSQLFDSFFFTGLCISFVMLYQTTGVEWFNTQFPTGWSIYFELSITTYIIKIIVAIFEIPFSYWAKSLFKNHKINDELNRH